VTKACQLFLVPSRSSNPPLYPSKGCKLGSVLRLLLFCCFLLGLTFESLEELGVRHVMPNELLEDLPSRKCVVTLALGLRPRERGCKVTGQEEGSPGVKAKALQRCG
jgi:hypothetical protein